MARSCDPLRWCSRTSTAGVVRERCGWFMPGPGRRLGTRNPGGFGQEKAKELNQGWEKAPQKRSGPERLRRLFSRREAGLFAVAILLPYGKTLWTSRRGMLLRAARARGGAHVA